MIRFVSDRARNIDRLRIHVAGLVQENWNEITISSHQKIVNGILRAIADIEALIRRNNVRVHEHPRLGVPPLSNDPKKRRLLRRLQNTVNVLCSLADVLAGGQGDPPTAEEKESVDRGEAILDRLLNEFMQIFPEPSSGAETE